MNVDQRSPSVGQLYIILMLWFFKTCEMEPFVARNEMIEEDTNDSEFGVCNMEESSKSQLEEMMMITDGSSDDIIFPPFATYRGKPTVYYKRIIGGTKVDIENYPYQVLIYKLEQRSCGGSIINENFVLTAAHCIWGNLPASFMRVRVGSSYPTEGGVLHYILWKRIHPNFNLGNQDFDVAVIRVTTPFQFGKSVQPIALVAPGTSLPVGAMGVVTGWGKTQENPIILSESLLMVEVPILPDRACLNAYGEKITDNMFCAGYRHGKRDSCTMMMIADGSSDDIIFPPFATYPGKSSVYDKRIIGGTKVDIENYPYQVLISKFDHSSCGGSIINENFVLTAAHCLSDNLPASFMRIRVGSNYSTEGGVLYNIWWKKIHPNFSRQKQDFDVGVIRVSTPFQFAKSVQPIALVASGTSLPVGAMGVVTGWGHTQENSPIMSQSLRMVQVPILPDSACLDAYGETITDTMFCAGYRHGKRDSCAGDSGGALVVGGTQIGIVSWGSGCARPNCPGVYTNLARVRDWVTQVTGV